MRDFEAIVADYDRTLTTPDAGALVPEAVEALREARAEGRRVVVVSGRGVRFLADALGDVADVLVAENGCLLRTRDGLVTPVGGAASDLARALGAVHLAGERGDVIASYAIEHEPLLREALSRAGVEAQLLRNRDRVMVVPAGVDKAVGMVAALDLLGIAPERAVAIGDGENDVPMLRAAGLGVAVANAALELRAVADEVTRLPGGEGVAQWVRAHRRRARAVAG